MPITGKTLVAWGHAPGPWFTAAIAAANAAAACGAGEADLRALVAARAPPPAPAPRALQPADSVPFHRAIEAVTEEDRANVAAVEHSVRLLLRTPTVTGAAIMPDACPAGPPGTIPVGGIARTRGAIHPGMHSEDICCSVAITVLDRARPAEVLDAAMRITHFGAGGRDRASEIPVPRDILARFEGNRFLARMPALARSHFATQGDGNHFFFVGTLRSSGRTAIVTHHGSRGPGAMLYKEGMAVAEWFRQALSPETQKQNAWIPSESPEGEAYWEALQIIRLWTKAGHFALHDRVGEAVSDKATDRFWNEHNFVFRRGDDFLHGKGATPAWGDYADDAVGEVLIPLNMSEPVLIARGADNPAALGFCPHGAGRNRSRTAHLRQQAGRTVPEIMAAETRGLDIRFFSGTPDISELPSAYKPAREVVRQIREFGLAEITDYVDPFGCIMAGDQGPGFRDFAARKRAARAAARRKG